MTGLRGEVDRRRQDQPGLEQLVGMRQMHQPGLKFSNIKDINLHKEKQNLHFFKDINLIKDNILSG